MQYRRHGLATVLTWRWTGTKLLVSYDRPPNPAMALDAAPRRVARDDYNLPPPTEGGERNPVQELLVLLRSRLDENDMRDALDLLREFVSLSEGQMAGDAAVRDPYAEQPAAEKRFGANFSRLKYCL